MRPLQRVTPTPEQITIISRNRPGVEVIRGAAGSGKTTTAILRLNSLLGMFLNRRQREEREEPLQVLVLTFNRTLRGYVRALAQDQIESPSDVNLLISTFGKWTKNAFGNPNVLNDTLRRSKIENLGKPIGLSADFLVSEVEYVMGRFLPEDFNKYLTARRDGRGISPRVERPTRERILEEVVYPYRAWKEASNYLDWYDLAVHYAREKMDILYDIVIVDETQDFSANQIRAITNQLREIHSLTFVVDTAQRIYASGFTWAEAGITVRAENSRRLMVNYRNTVEIARFAAPLIEGLPIDDDATIPDFSRSRSHGPVPRVLKGRFREQLRTAINIIKNEIDLDNESVAFLHPLGWFRDVTSSLDANGLGYVEITRQQDWPRGEQNIALCTLHSAKGLEFDHVIIIGLNQEVTSHGDDEGDDKLTMLRRLLAMGISRAKKSVVLGYKPEDASSLIGYLDEDTYEEIVV